MCQQFASCFDVPSSRLPPVKLRPVPTLPAGLLPDAQDDTRVLPDGTFMTVLKSNPGESLADMLKRRAGISRMESVYTTCISDQVGGVELESVFHITKLENGDFRVEFGADNDDTPRLLFRNRDDLRELARMILEVSGD